MRWCDLAFLHWPVAAEAVRTLVPPELDIDVYDGHAWLGIVPFRMEDVRLRGVPGVPTARSFAEINVRTYVRVRGRAGVWFFSLDAASRLAVRGARWRYRLPYFDAAIQVDRDGDTVRYASTRTHRRAPAAAFAGQYAPVGAAYEASPGTLEHFLVERYCLFTHHPRRGVGIIDVDHEPWTLRPGAARLTANTMASAAGVALPRQAPLVHVAAALDVRAWPQQPCDSRA